MFSSKNKFIVDLAKVKFSKALTSDVSIHVGRFFFCDRERGKRNKMWGALNSNFSNSFLKDLSPVKSINFSFSFQLKLLNIKLLFIIMNEFLTQLMLDISSERKYLLKLIIIINILMKEFRIKMNWHNICFITSHLFFVQWIICWVTNFGTDLAGGSVCRFSFLS